MGFISHLTYYVLHTCESLYLGAKGTSIWLRYLTLLSVAIAIEWAEENVIPPSNGSDAAQREGGHLTRH